MQQSLTLKGISWPRIASFFVGIGMMVASILTIQHYYDTNFPTSIYEGSFCDVNLTNEEFAGPVVGVCRSLQFFDSATTDCDFTTLIGQRDGYGLTDPCGPTSNKYRRAPSFTRQPQHTDRITLGVRCAFQRLADNSSTVRISHHWLL